MTMSARAGEALDAAVRLNPIGARQLYAILRTAPIAVKRKADDPFGPLGMMVVEGDSTVQPSPDYTEWIRPRLPSRLRPAARAFRKEWLGYRFTKVELANRIEQCLRRLGEALPSTTGHWEDIRPH